jgi:ABC-2 type transport system permease protein
MSAALTYEWMRIRSIRSTYWISAIAVVLPSLLSLFISWGSSYHYAHEQAPSGGEVDFLAPAIATQFAAVSGPYIVAYVATIIAVFAWGHEYRYGMIRTTLTTVSSRAEVWIAKFVVAIAWVLAVAATTMAVSTLLGWLFLHDDGVRFMTSAYFGQIGRTLLYVAIFASIATATASLVRNQTAALCALFIWPLAVEPILRLILIAIPGFDGLEKASRFLPYTAGDRLMRSSTIARAIAELLGGGQLSTLVGGLTFAAFAAALLTASFVLFLRRDA